MRRKKKMRRFPEQNESMCTARGSTCLVSCVVVQVDHPHVHCFNSSGRILTKEEMFPVGLSCSPQVPVAVNSHILSWHHLSPKSPVWVYRYNGYCGNPGGAGIWGVRCRWWSTRRLCSWRWAASGLKSKSRQFRISVWIRLWMTGMTVLWSVDGSWSCWMFSNRKNLGRYLLVLMVRVVVEANPPTIRWSWSWSCHVLPKSQYECIGTMVTVVPRDRVASSDLRKVLGLLDFGEADPLVLVALLAFRVGHRAVHDIDNKQECTLLYQQDEQEEIREVNFQFPIV